MDAQNFTATIRKLSHLSEDQVKRTVALADRMTPEERSELCAKLTTLNQQLAQTVKQLEGATIELQDIEKDAQRLNLAQREEADRSSVESSNAVEAVSQQISTL